MLTIITGCMFAGKSTKLIQTMRQHGDKSIVFKPVIDTRFSFNYVVTHNKISHECTPIKKSNEILELSKTYSVVGIDEAQFFDENIVTVCNILANSGKHVYVCGLSTDYLRRPFGYMPQLLAIADEIIKVYGTCKCGGKTVFNKRLTNSKEQILLGSEMEYESVCRNCFHEKEKLSIDELY